jgi:hypothetical protein
VHDLRPLASRLRTSWMKARVRKVVRFRQCSRNRWRDAGCVRTRKPNRPPSGAAGKQSLSCSLCRQIDHLVLHAFREQTGEGSLADSCLEGGASKLLLPKDRDCNSDVSSPVLHMIVQNRKSTLEKNRESTLRLSQRFLRRNVSRRDETMEGKMNW